jgi:hypothetical protein
MLTGAHPSTSYSGHTTAELKTLIIDLAILVGNNLD